uniref:AIG1-type G domain-containing protein n=1 Tax=Neolamprologus brichardi TaxID=32507 RepID=A0A3Q4G303_NEOBR
MRAFKDISAKLSKTHGRLRQAARREEGWFQYFLCFSEETEIRLILIGSRWAGKSSSGNTILRKERFECGRTRTAQSEVRHGLVDGRKLTVIDAPGWSSSLSLAEIPEGDKQRFNMFLCPPGPHVFLLVIDADASFNAKHLDAVTSHVELLGDGVWRHTIIVFTRGDWLGTNSIEQYIEGEGEALQSLVEQCGNRYHVVDNKNASDGTQISELLEKITETVAANGWGYFVPDQQIFQTIEERRRKVEEGAMLRKSQTSYVALYFSDCTWGFFVLWFHICLAFYLCSLHLHAI